MPNAAKTNKRKASPRISRRSGSRKMPSVVTKSTAAKTLATRTRKTRGGSEVGATVLSLSDLEVPVRDLLTHEQEIEFGTVVQENLEKLRTSLPLLVESYGLYLRQMAEVASGGRIVVAWFPLRERLEDDMEKLESYLQKARDLVGKRKRIDSALEAKINCVLNRGIRILRLYPLSPEMLFCWTRDGLELSEHLREPDPLTLLSRQKKVRRVLEETLARIASARDHLVLPNFRLVLKDVFRYHPAGMKRSDLFQEGILGLHRAVFRYKPEKKTRFSTYATYWIRQSIRKSLIDRANLVRVPQAVQEELRKAESEMNPEEARRIRRLMSDVVSMSVGEEDDPRDRLDYRLTRGKSRLDERFHLDVVPEEVKQALQKLTVREREVIRRRFGMGGDRTQTLEEIGVVLHLSRERIRQIEREALEKMRHYASLQAVYEELN